MTSRNCMIVCADATLAQQVARILATRKHAMLLSLGDYMQYTMGRTPEEVVELAGRPYFNKLHAQCVGSLAEYENTIIAASVELVLNPAHIGRAIGLQTVLLDLPQAATKRAVDAFAVRHPQISHQSKHALVQEFLHWKTRADHVIAVRPQDKAEGLAKEIYGKIRH